MSTTTKRRTLKYNYEPTGSDSDVPTPKRSNKRAACTEAVSSLHTLIENNTEIPDKVQARLLKQLNVVEKHVFKSRKQRDVDGDTPKDKGVSQFEKKMCISSEMCKFAGWEEGSLHSRVDVTKAVWNAIKSQGLQDSVNKRQCNLTPEIRQLLGVDEQLLMISYPQIQQYISKHLTKST
jgi:chromatin remodeling complex protein RSC6